MKEKILFIDDEINILQTFKRNLRKHFTLEVAEGPEQALAALKKMQFAVIISDLKMPGMDGISLLEKAKEIQPDAVRVILSGQGDFNAAIDAVNRGAIFRFLTKPCPPDILVETLRQSIQQYKLITAEKELLRGTLSGSVKVLVDVLSLVSPDAFGKSERIRTLVINLGKLLGVQNIWQLDVAAMLCQLGCVGLPEEILEKVNAGEELSAEEQQLFGMHPDIAGSLLQNIPRMKGVATIISRQLEKPDDGPPIESRIIRLALVFDRLEQQGKDPQEALEILIQRTKEDHSFDEDIIVALRKYVIAQEGGEIRKMRLDHVEAGMIAGRDYTNTEGTILLRKGQSISAASLSRLSALTDLLHAEAPIHILLPEELPQPAT